MRKLIVVAFVSLNGVVQAPGGPDEDTSGGFAHDLVDALSLRIQPITLGRGMRLFAEGTIPAAVRLTESQVTSTAVVLVRYERAGAIDAGSS